MHQTKEHFRGVLQILVVLLLAGCGPPDVAPEPPLPTARIALVTPTAAPTATAQPTPSPTMSPSPTTAATATVTPTAAPSTPPSPQPTATLYLVATDPNGPLDASVVERQIFELTNQLRAEHGLPPLAYSQELSAAARAHSCDLAARDAISHVSADGRTLIERLPVVVPPWEWPSESVAAGFGDAVAVMHAWFDEQPPDDWHRRNILDLNQRELGVGYCYDQDTSTGSRHYYTADYGRRSDVYPLVLAGGAAFTDAREVPYWLYGAGRIEQMRIGNSPDLSAWPWLPFQQSGSYTLANEPGPQTVFAELRDTNGNTQIVSTTVTLR